ncbi:hypothetical protein KUCAC02_011083, partial [Chaenocephalus aceratus]
PPQTWRFKPEVSQKEGDKPSTPSLKMVQLPCWQTAGSPSPLNQMDAAEAPVSVQQELAEEVMKMYLLQNQDG